MYHTWSKVAAGVSLDRVDVQRCVAVRRVEHLCAGDDPEEGHLGCIAQAPVGEGAVGVRALVLTEASGRITLVFT